MESVARGMQKELRVDKAMSIIRGNPTDNILIVKAGNEKPSHAVPRMGSAASAPLYIANGGILWLFTSSQPYTVPLSNTRTWD